MPVHPLVADMASASVKLKNTHVINRIRLGAARQHLDAVLIYEVYSKSEINKNALSLADITIIGGFLLPSRSENIEGFATALLIDVLQGYPYGTAQSSVDKQTAISSTWGWGSGQRKVSLPKKAKSQAAIQLTEEVMNMFTSLKEQLAER